MTIFRSKGRGPNRRVIPIEERRRPDRWRETGVVAASKRMRIPEIERRAEMLASDSRPVKLIAIRSRTDGLYDAYMRSFSNRQHAESIARRLRKGELRRSLNRSLNLWLDRSAANRQNHFAGFQKQAGDADRRFDKTAVVVAQIQEQSFELRSPQPLDGIVNLQGRLRFEA